MQPDSSPQASDRAAAVGMGPPVYLPFRDYSLVIATISIVSAMLLGTSIAFGLYNLVRPGETRNTAPHNEQSVQDTPGELLDKAKESKERETLQKQFNDALGGQAVPLPDAGGKPDVTDTGVKNSPANAAAQTAPANKSNDSLPGGKAEDRSSKSDGSGVTSVPDKSNAAAPPAPSNKSNDSVPAGKADDRSSKSDGSGVTSVPEPRRNKSDAAEPEERGGKSNAGFNNSRGGEPAGRSGGPQAR
jgi:hypothetical protein